MNRLVDGRHHTDIPQLMVEPTRPSNFLYDHIAAVIVLDAQDRVVLQLRDNFPHIANPNHWGLFGGRIEPGETWVEAAAREVGEELTLPTEANELTWMGAFDVRANCTFYTYLYRAGRLLRRAVITEGQAFRLFTSTELITMVQQGGFGGHALSDSAQQVLRAYIHR